MLSLSKGKMSVAILLPASLFLADRGGGIGICPNGGYSSSLLLLDLVPFIYLSSTSKSSNSLGVGSVSHIYVNNRSKDCSSAAVSSH